MITIVAFEDDENFLALLEAELVLREVHFTLDTYTTVAAAKRATLSGADVLLLDYYAPDGNFHTALSRNATIPIVAISTARSKNEQVAARATSVTIEPKVLNNTGLSVSRIADAVIMQTT